MMSLAGALLFYYAPSLCRNVIFHYTTGVGAGILFSLLIVTYFAQKKVSVRPPSRPSIQAVIFNRFFYPP